MICFVHEGLTRLMLVHFLSEAYGYSKLAGFRELQQGSEEIVSLDAFGTCKGWNGRHALLTIEQHGPNCFPLDPFVRKQKLDEIKNMGIYYQLTECSFTCPASKANGRA